MTQNERSEGRPVAVISPKKLIEVALPLDAINVEAAREKSIRHGHPSTLHLWWARRPLAAARAVIFSQLVNDPASLWEAQNPGQVPNPQQKGAFTKRRAELFKLITELVKWENTSNDAVLNPARAEIRKAWREVCALNAAHPDAATLFDPDRMPGLHDPFAGGGTIPLEAQRLGLEAFASDLNPVAVLINKAMIELPPKFAGQPPVHPAVASDPKHYGRTWKGAQGLAEDVRRYGAWMRDEAERRIGHLYPKVNDLTVIAWLWARTVKSPNPAFSHVAVPLVSSFILSSKPGKETWVEPIVEGDTYRFEVRKGTPPPRAVDGTKAPGRGSNFRCVLSGAVIDGDYIKAEGQAGRMGARLMAVVAEGVRARIYLNPTAEMERVAASAAPTWRPSGDVPARLTGGTCVPYGLREWGDLFTPRQLVALTTFSDLVTEARERARKDGATDDYANAIATFVTFAVSRSVDRGSSLCSWDSSPKMEALRNTFGRQALPMVWDFAEGNPFSASSGNWGNNVEWAAKVVDLLPAFARGAVVQADAQSQFISQSRFVSTDPPYYDNIGYADLSDFFYVWLRRSLRTIYPSIFNGIAVPKTQELVATPYRHGSKERAESFFLDGMTTAMHGLAAQSHPSAPVTIFYAFKQSETSTDTGTSSAGWETFLDAVLRAGFSLTGTWPMRTELGNRMISSGTNALASSIVLVCRRRPDTAATTSRREFLRELNAVLPLALDEMTKGTVDGRSPVAPVDLSQAIIGPGMAVFSKYRAVLEADGTPMTVKTALQLINRFLAEDDFDGDTQFCLHWFDEHGWDAGPYGDADTLARAKGTSVGGLAQAGVVASGAGKVSLVRPADYPADWDPAKDHRLPVWEALHQLIRAFRADGESGAAHVLSAVQSQTEAIRQLAYRLYTLCERRGWAEDARAYNELVSAWSVVEIAAVAVAITPKTKAQMDLFGDRQ